MVLLQALPEVGVKLESCSSDLRLKAEHQHQRTYARLV